MIYCSFLRNACNFSNLHTYINHLSSNYFSIITSCKLWQVHFCWCFVICWRPLYLAYPPSISVRQLLVFFWCHKASNDTSYRFTWIPSCIGYDLISCVWLNYNTRSCLNLKFCHVIVPTAMFLDFFMLVFRHFSQICNLHRVCFKCVIDQIYKCLCLHGTCFSVYVCGCFYSYALLILKLQNFGGNMKYEYIDI